MHSTKGRNPKTKVSKFRQNKPKNHHKIPKRTIQTNSRSKQNAYRHLEDENNTLNASLESVHTRNKSQEPSQQTQLFEQKWGDYAPIRPLMPIPSSSASPTSTASSGLTSNKLQHRKHFNFNKNNHNNNHYSIHNNNNNDNDGNLHTTLSSSSPRSSSAFYTPRATISTISTIPLSTTSFGTFATSSSSSITSLSTSNLSSLSHLPFSTSFAGNTPISRTFHSTAHHHYIKKKYFNDNDRHDEINHLGQIFEDVERTTYHKRHNGLQNDPLIQLIHQNNPQKRIRDVVAHSPHFSLHNHHNYGHHSSYNNYHDELDHIDLAIVTNVIAATPLHNHLHSNTTNYPHHQQQHHQQEQQSHVDNIHTKQRQPIAITPTFHPSSYIKPNNHHHHHHHQHNNHNNNKTVPHYQFHINQHNHLNTVHLNNTSLRNMSSTASEKPFHYESSQGQHSGMGGGNTNRNTTTTSSIPSHSSQSNDSTSRHHQPQQHQSSTSTSTSTSSSSSSNTKNDNDTTNNTNNTRSSTKSSEDTQHATYNPQRLQHHETQKPSMKPTFDGGDIPDPTRQSSQSAKATASPPAGTINDDVLSAMSNDHDIRATRVAADQALPQTKLCTGDICVDPELVSKHID